MKFAPLSSMLKGADKGKKSAPAPEVDPDLPVLENPYRHLPVPDQVRALFDEIALAHFNHRMSTREIAKALEIPPLSMHMALQTDAELVARMNALRALQAEDLIDEVVEYSRKAARGADFKTAGTLALKAAEKLDPKRFGNKSAVELTGADGGAIKTEVQAMDPGEAYRAMLGGGA